MIDQQNLIKDVLSSNDKYRYNAKKYKEGVTKQNEFDNLRLDSLQMTIYILKYFFIL